MALCRALNASANPPAKLPPLIEFGVTLPESVPLSALRPTPLSLAGGGGGTAFLAPAAGLFVGGAGGVALVFAAGNGLAALPFIAGAAGARAGAAGGGGGGART